MSPKDQIETIESFLRLVNSGDMVSASELIHPDFDLVEQPGLPYAGEYHGRDGFLGLMEAAGRTWTRWVDAPYPYELAVEGNRVFKEVRFTATAAATGVEIEMDFMEVFELEDGLIRRVRAYYWDPEGIRAATSPAPI
ncbi:nuclear transport factor 2 family protein [Aeromicrobium fastidiosum]|uniref:Nuclear transport factor 2 family protein n=1 Tax=Aeromicrobium fastidiosum TaxID=52699 RepID=A0A641AP95_9ACTN|nr:nuclear transport factor 2 family protein [Aeromicrobium fastidiosum]KAA1379916.1 nuclear transport factor 2 family protein [Aeromicrobium fastidiosum]MBP2389422.1 ketosteroid isomerase-like protein [Aeromicrobium fastidiosum]